MTNKHGVHDSERGPNSPPRSNCAVTTALSLLSRAQKVGTGCAALRIIASAKPQRAPAWLCTLARAPNVDGEEVRDVFFRGVVSMNQERFFTGSSGCGVFF